MQPPNNGKKLNDASEYKINIEKEEFRDVCFLLRLDKTHCGELLEDLNKGACKGRDEYPKTVTGTNEL